MFVLGCPNLIISVDHKPLVKIFGDQPLENVKNPRLQHFKERAMAYNYRIKHTPSELHLSADATSRFPAPNEPDNHNIIRSTVITGYQSKSNPKAITWERIVSAAATYTICRDLSKCIMLGFPSSKGDLLPHQRPFWAMRDDLYINVLDGIPIKDNRILIPQSLLSEVLECLHAAHQGVNGMIANADQRLFWPGLDASIRLTRAQCCEYNQMAPSQPSKPLCAPSTIDIPFQHTVTDFFEFAGNKYIVYADRFTGRWLVGWLVGCWSFHVDFMPKIEAIVFEINLKKRKWLFLGIYNPHKDMTNTFVTSVGEKLNELSLKYENIIILGDFNSEMCEEVMQMFCNTFNFKCLVKEPTCFKSINSPSCIDLILTNRSSCFQNTTVIETGLSDFHKLTLTVMKSTFQKQVPKILNYRNYKRFNNELFQNDLMFEISKIGLNSICCQQFENIFMLTLNKHAPSKTRYVRANNSPFMNNNIYKAIMVRSRLRNKYLKLKTEESKIAYRKQRNYCVSLIRKAKCNFYEHLDPNLICDNRKFWKQVKPFFADKTPSNSNITLLENGEIVSDPSRCTEIFNNFFIESVSSLDIDRNLNITDCLISNNLVEKAIDMFKNHPSIIKINQAGFLSDNFTFQTITNENVLKVINSIDSSKAYQKENIPQTF